MSHKNANIVWDVTERPSGFGEIDWDPAILAVLMDIRREAMAQTNLLRQLTNTMTCHNAIDIPNILRGIRRNTHKPKRRKKKS